ncbi:MAG: tRNA pseudouridine(38-40) synthase TruA [Polyangiales bacterium]
MADHPYGVRLVLAYDGTGFAGWQRQPGQRTVQSIVGGAVHRMTIHHSRVRGASRTDAGVHALCQIAAFDCDRDIPGHGWLHALNALLPDDVVVREAERCEPGYQPRFDASHKLYRYVIEVGPVRNPLSRHRAWHVGPALARRDVRAADRGDALEDWLDLGAMREAAASLEGTHDFGTFRASGDARDNTVRTLHAVRLVPGWGGGERTLAVEVIGNAFLKHMVRILVGTLVDVGRKRLRAADVPALLEPGTHRNRAGPTAPGHGLTLVHIAPGRES